MNIIQLEVTPPEENVPTSGIRIFIDGVDLVDLVRAHEKPFAAAEGKPDLAGSYRGLHPGNERDPDHSGFLGTRPWDEAGRGIVLGCLDSELVSWPLLCRVVVGERAVTWSDFRQLYRVGHFLIPDIWDYSDFGPFVFDREQYLEAVSVLWTPEPELPDLRPPYESSRLEPGQSVEVLDLTFTLPEGRRGGVRRPGRMMYPPDALIAVEVESTGRDARISIHAYPLDKTPLGGDGMASKNPNFAPLPTPDWLHALSASGEPHLLRWHEVHVLAFIPRASGSIVAVVERGGSCSSLDDLVVAMRSLGASLSA